MSEENAKWPMVNMIWVEDKEITLRATDNEGWELEKEDGYWWDYWHYVRGQVRDKPGIYTRLHGYASLLLYSILVQLCPILPPPDHGKK